MPIISTLPVEEYSKTAMKEYTGYVAKARCLPHLDMKPVQKRLIWALIRMKARDGKGTFKKCASIIGECFVGETKVSRLNGTECQLKDLKLDETFYVYGCEEDGTVLPCEAVSLGVTKTVTKLAKVTLDNGKEELCTLDHPWMLRDGSYLKAESLAPGTNLMSLYRKLDDNGYELFLNNNTGDWIYTYKDIAYKFDKTITDTWENIKENYNHKVVSVEILEYKEPVEVYDINVAETCNFALSSGVFVHNSLKFHPHSDKTTYESLVNMINFPNSLVEGRGGFTSLYGDPPPAMRYPEAKTSKVFEHLIDETMFKIGSFIPNFDDSEVEPVNFQTKLPLVPLMGCAGIGVGLTTNLPSFTCKSVKSFVLSQLNPEKYKEVIEYAYGANYYGSRATPVLGIFKRNNREYLNITDIPIGANASITIDNKLIQNLLSTKQIEIFDDSNIETGVNIKIFAPEDIQNMIVKSMSRSIIENFTFFHKRLRLNLKPYISEWILDRKEFISRREYYLKIKDWLDTLVKMTLTQISNNIKGMDAGSVAKYAETKAAEIYDVEVKKLPPGCTEFIPTQKEFIETISMKPIKSLKAYDVTMIPIPVLTDIDINKILIEEILSIDESIFSKKSNEVEKVVKSKFTSSIIRYVTLGTYGISVDYRKKPRVICWEATGSITAITKDANYKNIGDREFGDIETIDNKQVIGFTLPGHVIVVITESKKLITLKRLSSLNEPIISAFPATKMIINGKECLITSGLVIEKLDNYKILE